MKIIILLHLKLGQNGAGPLSTFGLITCNDLLNQGNCGLLKVELFDDYCDGWAIYGASMDVIIDGTPIQTISLPTGCGPETILFPVDSGALVDLVYSTIYQNEHSYKVYDQFGALIHEKTLQLIMVMDLRALMVFNCAIHLVILWKKKRIFLFILILPTLY